MGKQEKREKDTSTFAALREWLPRARGGDVFPSEPTHRHMHVFANIYIFMQHIYLHVCLHTCTGRLYTVYPKCLGSEIFWIVWVFCVMILRSIIRACTPSSCEKMGLNLLILVKEFF